MSESGGTGAPANVAPTWAASVAAPQHRRKGDGSMRPITHTNERHVRVTIGQWMVEDPSATTSELVDAYIAQYAEEDDRAEVERAARIVSRAWEN